MLAWITLLLSVFSPAHGQKPTGLVKAVAHETGEGGDRIEISLGGQYLPTIFMIDGEKPRLVLDFADCGYGGRQAIPVAANGLVQGIRVGFHSTPKQKTRLVADLLPGARVSWNQEFLVHKNLLVISVMSVDRADGQTPVAGAVTTSPSTSAAPPATPAAPDEPAIQAAPVPVVLVAGRSKVRVASVEDPVAEAAVTEEKLADATPATSAETLPSSAEVPVVATDRQAAQPVLRDVSFDNAFSQSGEMVLLQLSDFQPPEITTQEKNPPRIFCDFADAVIDARLAGEMVVGGKYVEKIRILQEEARTRVILDLVPGSNYDLQQVYFKEDNLFVLIVNLLPER